MEINIFLLLIIFRVPSVWRSVFELVTRGWPEWTFNYCAGGKDRNENSQHDGVLMEKNDLNENSECR